MATKKCHVTPRLTAIVLASASAILPSHLFAALPNLHHGTYEANVSEAQNVYFYEQDNQQYLYSVWGVVPITVNDKAEFQAVDLNVGLSGQFYHPNDEGYQSGKLNFNGFSMSFGRVQDLKDDDRIAVLFDDPFWQSISSPHKCENALWKVNTKATYDQDLIQNLINASQSNTTRYADTNSLLIAKDGKLVVEEYFNGWQPEFPHMIQSITKSVTSLAAGVAIDKQLISGAESKMAELLPNYQRFLQDDKSDLTLKHFLTMSSGLDWDEWTLSYENPNNVRLQEMTKLDPTEFVLDRELMTKPGVSFRYNGGLVTVVGELIAEKSGQDNLAAYLRHSDFNKLCLKDAYVMKQAGEVTNAAGGGYLRPRDMLKVGQLVAQQGEWQGEQIVSKQWIEESVTGYVPTSVGGHDYGYYWWTKEVSVNEVTYPVTYGLGYGGQVIAVVEALDLVVARTATHFDDMTPNHEMMRDYIIPAFVTETQ
ncbi:class C beta-lactamase-related serine hydrolase [Vibrio aquaticus]|uniref:Class C beta-lactamase-related serine hydrolase n=1 Tax=Vibrio aquaticus TaxID=2496559 RepID=A0A432D2W1_9VIBR|nr:serine hydrolase [Vibrio aquaticus]RTZ18291.1 class C beta-lactamase-related serine hydrolase [Vibrio aquaticus]